ncbi:thioredoxin-like domain-containing protein [Singulisphaera sp. PoT]|uniref:thioredoxin-like domain-containing protein n=1 Tax=Singulisphaera sp. PoT TaxID=3411797 RepID=UPI003BF4A35E
MRRQRTLIRWIFSAFVAAGLFAELPVGPSAGKAWGAPPSSSRAGRSKIRVERTARQDQPPLSFDGATGWINTQPIRLEELKGKIVLLDFWTYCCINCHHVLPDLAKLEEKYKNELVVIGVHTAKFFAEQDTENIRRKVSEYKIKHPVINDANQVIWNRFEVNSWPTLVLIDPEGKYVGSVSGEGHYAALDRVIGQLAARHKEKGDLNTSPVVFFPESDKPDTTGLLYPGKILADEKSKRLFISDTAHNRIVLTDFSGKNPVTIGNGVAGLVDGGYEKSQFNRPQGMCLVDDILYVADTENHSIRAINLKNNKVETVAGTGVQTHNFKGVGAGTQTGLNSPWDLVLIPGTKSIAIAMAGSHQIWRYDIENGTVGHWAGTGREDIQDGPIAQALFAQPSGLAADADHLYVADSEVSAVRAISLGRKPLVHTIVGLGLFKFADVDGVGEDVRLQHCLGVAFGNDKLYIADSYNNKIKVCDPRAKRVDTLVGNTEPGSSDNPPRFYEPGGLSVAGTDLYVADTNNHAIRVVNLNDGAVKTLEIEGLSPPKPPRRAPAFPNAQVLNLKEQTVKPSKEITIDVRLPLKEGFKVNDQAPFPYMVEVPSDSTILASNESEPRKLETPAQRFNVKVKLAKVPEDRDSLILKLSVSAFVCDEDSNLCQIKSYVWNAPIKFTKDGSVSATFDAKDATANAATEKAASK